MKKFICLILALAMLSGAAPSVYADDTAAGEIYSASELAALAGYVFDGGYHNGAITVEESSAGDLIIDNITAPEHWTGWTSSWSGENITDGTATNVNAIVSGEANYIQFYGAQVTDLSSAASVKTSAAVQEGTCGRDYIVVEFQANGSGSAEHDYGIYDVDGHLVDSFRHLGTTSIGPFFADNRGGRASYATNQLFTDLSYTDDFESDWLFSEGPYFRIAYCNNGSGYTASYYYSADGLTYTRAVTKSFSSGSVNGIGEIKAFPANGVSNVYANTQLRELKIYAGNYPEAENAVRVNVSYTAGGAEVYSESSIYDKSVSKGCSFGEKYYYDSAANVLYYAEAATFTESKSVEMTVVKNYTSTSEGGTVTVNGGTYTVEGGSVIVNGNFVTGDTTAWVSRYADGADITDASVAYDEEIGGNVMTLQCGGSWTNSVGTAWRVIPGQAYYMAFDIGGLTAVTPVHLGITDGYTVNTLNNRIMGTNTMLYSYYDNMSPGQWNHLETVFTPETDTVYFQASYADLQLANVELVPVSGGAGENVASKWIAYPGTPEESGFVHPGVLATEEELERAAAAVAASEEPYISSWNILLGSSFSGPSDIRAATTIQRGGTGQNYGQLYQDMARIYQMALRYKISGYDYYGVQVANYLNTWSATLDFLTGNADRYLASGIYGYQLAAAAELIRDREDFNLEQTQQMLLNVFYEPLCERFLYSNKYGADHNDAYIGNYWANWDLCNMAASVAIGIFCDRRDIYDRALEYYKYGGGNGSIYNAIPFIHVDDDGGVYGQWQESGRDQGHTQLGVGLMASVCEMAWNQGDDLYGWADNRLMYAAEYVAKYNNGDDVPFAPYTRWYGWQWNNYDYQTVVANGSRGSNRPIWAMIYNHYVNRKGYEMPNVKKMMDNMGAESGPTNGSVHSDNYDQPGFGTLLYTREQEIDNSAALPEAEIEDGIYEFTVKHSGKLLTAAGNKAVQSDNRDVSSQKWKVTHLGSGQYTIQNVETGLYLQIEDGSYSDGASAALGEYTGAYSQKFAILPLEIDGYYRITAVHTDKCLDVLDGGTANGTKVIQYCYRYSDNQRWSLTKVEEESEVEQQGTVNLIHHYEFNTGDRTAAVDSVTRDELTFDGAAEIKNGKLLLTGGSLKLQDELFEEGQKEFTISFFVNSCAYQSFRAAFALGSDTGQYFLYYPDYGDGSSRVEFMTDSVSMTAVSGAFAAAAEWKHVAVAFEDLGDVRRISLYENGVYVSSVNTKLTLDEIKGNNNYIGKSHYYGTQDWVGMFLGYIDDFRIYDGVLGDGAIGNLYAARPAEDKDFVTTVKGPYLAGAGDDDEAVEKDTLYLKYSIDFGEIVPLADYYQIQTLYLYDGVWTEAGTTDINTEELTDGKITIGIIPETPNAAYGIKVWAKLPTTSDIFSFTDAGYASLYNLVLEDLALSSYSGDSENKNQTRIDNANKVIAMGGFYTGDISSELRDKIMDINTDDEGIITVEIKQDLYDFGIGFVCGNNDIWVGSGAAVEAEETAEEYDWYKAEGEEGNRYRVMMIDTVNRTAALSNSVETAQTQEAEIFYLEEVELKLVEEIIEEYVINEQFSTELVFEEIL